VLSGDEQNDPTIALSALLAKFSLNKKPAPPQDPSLRRRSSGEIDLSIDLQTLQLNSKNKKMNDVDGKRILGTGNNVISFSFYHLL